MSLEILLAQGRNDRGQHRLFSRVAVEIARCRLRLRAIFARFRSDERRLSNSGRSASADRDLWRAARERSVGPRNLCVRPRGFDYQLRGSPTIDETNFDSHDGEHRSTAHPPTNDREAADALVAARRPLDAEGPDRGYEYDIRARSRQRRALGSPPVSPGSVSTPKFETVSYKRATGFTQRRRLYSTHAREGK